MGSTAHCQGLDNNGRLAVQGVEEKNKSPHKESGALVLQAQHENHHRQHKNEDCNRLKDFSNHLSALHIKKVPNINIPSGMPIKNPAATPS